MRPSISIQIGGRGGYKANRYLYGGIGGISTIQYNKYIPYSPSDILYDGSYTPEVRHLYGAHICYGGPGGTWYQTDTQPTVEQRVINGPTLNLL